MANNWIGPETQGLCTSGVNTSQRPDLIQPDQVVWGTNMQVRDGKPRTRGRFIERAILPSGIVQGAGYYSLRNGMIVVSIGGELTRITFTDTQANQSEIPLGFQNGPNLLNAWMVETQGAFVIQDGQSDAIIYNGSIARRADPALKEVPRGTVMAYGNGRLWVATDGGHTLVAGDIAGTAVNSDLFFTENTYLQGGGGLYFAAPAIGMSFMPANNTATGYGSLMVFGASFTKTIRAEITQRDYWSQIPGFQVDTLDSIGTCGQFAITRVNQDLYWRDASGQVRSLRAASAEQEAPGNSGLSREVSRITDYETKSWLGQCSGTYFDNRIFFTASPFLLPNGAKAFKNLISLDCAPLATMRGKAPPAYDGQYCGANFVRLLTGRFSGSPRMFAISTDDDGMNRLWEYEPEKREDAYLTDSMSELVPRRIKSEVEFRRFNFGNATKIKQIVRADFYPAEIMGDVNVKLYWRVGNRNQWQFCDEVNFCARMTDGGADGAEPVPDDFQEWTLQGLTWDGWVAALTGISNAQALRETATDSLHRAFRAVEIEGGEVSTFSVQLKKAGARNTGYISINSDFGGIFVRGNFDLDAQTITVSGSGAVSSRTATITSLGSGWSLVKITGIFAESDTGTVRILGTSAGSDSYMGNTVNGFNAFAPMFGSPISTHNWLNLAAQERAKIKSFTFPDTKDAITNYLQTIGYDFQIRLVWEGDMLIDRIDLWARQLSDEPFSNIPETDSACLLDPVRDNVISYSIIP